MSKLIVACSYGTSNTKVAYTNNSGIPFIRTWPRGVSHIFVKLLLEDPTIAHETFRDKALNEVGFGLFHIPPGLQAIDVVTEFLSKLWAHVKPTLNIDENTPVAIVLTAPVLWSTRTRNELYRAAMTGFGMGFQTQITMLTEAEAAAQSFFDTWQRTIKAGDCITICNCGGGTVVYTLLYDCHGLFPHHNARWH
ncbi:hypothetical protein BJX76DRAFT_181113 [Aspergillus varians]